MPALIEAKLKDRLMLLQRRRSRRGDRAGEAARARGRARAFERDEAAQKQAAEEFAATPR